VGNKILTVVISICSASSAARRGENLSSIVSILSYGFQEDSRQARMTEQITVY
jgi:hypothetical protein